MGKTRDGFKKITDTKGKFHATMGSIKDRNHMGLTEAEDIKKRWQEYTEELYKKDLHDQDNNEGVITPIHLESDILECEVKWVFPILLFSSIFALVTEEGFLTAPCYSLKLCIQRDISFLFFSFAFGFSSFHSYLKGLLSQPFYLFAFLFLGDGLDSCFLYNVTNIHP